MYGQVIFHRRPDPSLKAAEVSFRLASGTKWRLAERRVAMVRLLVKVRHHNGCAPSRPRPIVLPRCSRIIPLPGDRQRRGE